MFIGFNPMDILKGLYFTSKNSSLSFLVQKRKLLSLNIVGPKTLTTDEFVTKVHNDIVHVHRMKVSIFSRQTSVSLIALETSRQMLPTTFSRYFGMKTFSA